MGHERLMEFLDLSSSSKSNYNQISKIRDLNIKETKTKLYSRWLDYSKKHFEDSSDMAVDELGS